MIGKLKHTLKQRCPQGGKMLELRVRDTGVMRKGIMIDEPTEYICCSSKTCDYEQHIEQRRRRDKNEE